jgi:hypothetical protein
MDIFRSPRLRLFLSMVFTILIGIFSSLFATEITVNGVITWSLTTSATSFWWLSILSISWIAVQIFYWREDERVLAFGDEDYCIAHIRKSKLEAVAAQLKSNPSHSGLVNASQVLKELGVKRK